MEHLCDSNQCSSRQTANNYRLIEEFSMKAAECATGNRAMAERLRLEILDHLTEASAEAETSMEAAIGRFGPADSFAETYRATIVEARFESVKAVAFIALASVFVGMRLRNFFLAPDWRHDLQSTHWGDLLLFIDRYAFLFAALLMVAGVLSRREWIGSAKSWGRMLCQSPHGNLITIAMPAVLLLCSALAIIGSMILMAGPSVIDISELHLGSVTFAALLTVCIVIMTRLLRLALAYSPTKRLPYLLARML